MTLNEIKHEMQKLMLRRKDYRYGEGVEEYRAAKELLARIEIAERITDALLDFERTSYIGTPATKELMILVRDFKGII